jgi:hypothetical protein
VAKDGATPDPFTPVKRYSFIRSSEGIKILTTPTAGRRLLKERILYSFKRRAQKNKADKESVAQRLIGFTEQGSGRVSYYLWGCNHPKEDRSTFSQEVNEHPEDFSFGIIRTLKDDEDSSQAETEAILAKESIRHGYNTNLGGGGGRSHKAEDRKCPYTIHNIVSMIKEDYQSPESKPLHRVIKKHNGARKEVLAPVLSKEDKKAQNIVYEFLFDPTGEKKDRIHHPGYTTTTLGERVSKHMTCVNNPESKGGRTISLYREIRAHPEWVKIRRFNVDALVKKGIPVTILETAFMQFFHERGEKVRNLGSGGKGSVAQCKRP